MRSETVWLFIGSVLFASALVGGIIMAAVGASVASPLLVIGGAILGGIGMLAWIAWMSYLATT